MEKVLIAGSTGYLEKFIIKELKKQGYYTIALTRNVKKLRDINRFIDKCIEAEVTKPESLIGYLRALNFMDRLNFL